MKRVAIVGPDFAPSSLPPALRIRFFAQHLPAFGWEPIVVTVDPRYYEAAVDPENERLLPDALQVIRTPAWPVAVTRKVGVGDIGMRSLWHQWRAVAELCRSDRVDLLLIPIPPYVPAVIGRLIYDRFRVPYVVDYIDPWVSDAWRRQPRQRRLPKRALSDRLSRILEPYALRHVAHLVGVSAGTTAPVIRRYRWLREADATAIPYGGEPADFEYLHRHPRRNPCFDPSDGLLHVSCVGRAGWDILPSLRAVFRAVQQGLGEQQQLFARVRLHFVGTSYAPEANARPRVAPVAAEMGVLECVDEHPARVSYLDALQILLDSHALLALGSSQPHYTASKIFPYILARRPLLAVFHEASSVVGIMRTTGAGDVVTFDGLSVSEEKVKRIKHWLGDIDSLSSGFRPATQWGPFAPYTARAMTGRLASVLDAASARAAGS